jgi:hypothetical protein
MFAIAATTSGNVVTIDINPAADSPDGLSHADRH